MDIRNWSKDFITQFLEIYKSLPELWKVKSKDYSNKDKKNVAYEKLLKKIQEIEPTANIPELKKKINSIRTSWRKEYKKILQSQKSGSAADDIYVPHLWYFEMLNFLADQETPMPSKSNVEKENIFQQEKLSETYSETECSEDELSSSVVATSDISMSDNIHISLPERTSTKRKRENKRAGAKHQNSHEEVLQIIGEKIKNQAPNTTDRFDHLGNNISGKLRELKNYEQRIIAEKLLSDVLFQAELGNHTQHSTIQLQEAAKSSWQSANTVQHRHSRENYESWNLNPLHRHQGTTSSQWNLNTRSVENHMPSITESTWDNLSPSDDPLGPYFSNFK